MSLAAPDAAIRTPRGLAREHWLLPALAALLVAAFILGVGLGPVTIAPARVLRILLEVADLAAGDGAATDRAIVLAVRLPRACLAVLVGSGLAAAGALMQGLFRNPLADPGLVGVSAGSALAAVATIVAAPLVVPGALKVLGPWALPVAAFAGGMLAFQLIQRIASRSGRTSIALMLLAGIAVNALAGALTGFQIFASDDRQLRDVTFWTMGSLGGAGWTAVAALAPMAGAALVLSSGLARALNAFMLGEREAGHLGIDVEAMKRRATIAVAVAVGGAVAAAGIIGFVGLVVPHLVRLLAGSDNRLVLPGSALLGAVLLLAADLVARTAVAPAELPVGLVTSALGAPFFLWLLLRRGDQP